MKRAFADLASVTVTAPVTFGQNEVGSGIIASLADISKRLPQQLDPAAGMNHPAMWPVLDASNGTPQWSPFAGPGSGQEGLQPPQLCANFQPGGTASGLVHPSFVGLPHYLLSPLQHASPHSSMQPAGLCSTPQGPAGPERAPIATQLSSSHIPCLAAEQQQLQDQQQQQQGQQQQQQQQGQPPQLDLQHHEDATATATVTLTAAAGGLSAAGKAAPHKEPPADSLLSELQDQLQLRQDAVAQQVVSGWDQLPLQPQPPCMPLGELQLLLPAVHAEYKAEMQLMLKACQVASNVTKHSTATGTTLLMDQAARDQLQRQVLTNCNEKHATVMAAFKHAAQAVEAAAAAGGCKGFTHQPDAPSPAAAAAGSMSEVWRALQQLRSHYQQELVAATSALFAICRGFGQRYALSPAASAAIKVALAATQRQHARVEQLWQDVVLAAAGGV